MKSEKEKKLYTIKVKRITASQQERMETGSLVGYVETHSQPPLKKVARLKMPEPFCYHPKPKVFGIKVAFYSPRNFKLLEKERHNEIDSIFTHRMGEHWVPSTLSGSQFG